MKRGPKPKHNKTGTKVYRAWYNMKRRCLAKNHPSYKNYGYRGIKIDDRWLDFQLFYDDMGEPPTPKHSLDRINNNGPYCKSNCRWADYATQLNNKRNNVNYTCTKTGRTKTLSQWERIIGGGGSLIRERLSRGWSMQRIVETPKAESGWQRKYITCEKTGKKLSMSEWSKKLGSNDPRLIKSRIKNGWTVQKAISTPVKNRPLTQT